MDLHSALGVLRGGGGGNEEGKLSLVAPYRQKTFYKTLYLVELYERYTAHYFNRRFVVGECFGMTVSRFVTQPPDFVRSSRSPGAVYRCCEGIYRCTFVVFYALTIRMSFVMSDVIIEGRRR